MSHDYTHVEPVDPTLDEPWQEMVGGTMRVEDYIAAMMLLKQVADMDDTRTSLAEWRKFKAAIHAFVYDGKRPEEGL